MNSVFILVFLIMAPSLIRRQMRGVPWDWRPWASLAITALLGAVTVFPVLCGKHLPRLILTFFQLRKNRKKKGNDCFALSKI